jgi:hypothetical protein
MLADGSEICYEHPQPSRSEIAVLASLLRGCADDQREKC